MLATQHSMENSLRWIRRLIVIILIIANLLTVMMADAASAAGNSPLSFPETWEEKSITLTSTSTLGEQPGFSGAFTSATWISADGTSLMIGNETFSLAGVNDTAVSVPAVMPESTHHN
jgi:hypothetical protein